MTTIEQAYKMRNQERQIRDAAPDMLLALQAIEALCMSVAASKDAVLELARPAIKKALRGRYTVDD